MGNEWGGFVCGVDLVGGVLCTSHPTPPSAPVGVCLVSRTWAGAVHWSRVRPLWWSRSHTATRAVTLIQPSTGLDHTRRSVVVYLAWRQGVWVRLSSTVRRRGHPHTLPLCPEDVNPADAKGPHSPVLKHGPRSLTSMRVFGSRASPWMRSESKGRGSSSPRCDWGSPCGAPTQHRPIVKCPTSEW